MAIFWAILWRHDGRSFLWCRYLIEYVILKCKYNYLVDFKYAQSHYSNYTRQKAENKNILKKQVRKFCMINLDWTIGCDINNGGSLRC